MTESLKWGETSNPGNLLIAGPLLIHLSDRLDLYTSGDLLQERFGPKVDGDSPQPIDSRQLARILEAGLTKVFVKLDRVALGLSVGAVGGLVLFLGTLFVVLGAGPLARPLLALLGQYFPGYEVTWSGTGLGLAYGFVTGFAGGWSFAFLRNACLFVS